MGGTIHLITNNQVGFTTEPSDARSTTYASDLAKGFDVPVIHVNADDAEGCLDAIRLAMLFREQFREDVIIDLVGYRRHGHNEGDEPAYTQPLMYALIKDHPTARALYAKVLETRGRDDGRRGRRAVRGGLSAPGERAAGAEGRARRTGEHEAPARKVVTGQEPVDGGAGRHPHRAQRAAADHLARGLHGAPQAAQAARAPPAGDGARGRHRMGPRRSARVRVAAG